MDTLSKNLSTLLEGARLPLTPRDLPEIVIYGAGNCGKNLARVAKAQGIAVLAFLDARAEFLREIDGIPCHPPAGEVARSFAQKRIPAVIAVFNYAADPRPIIALLSEAGFASIISYFEIHERLQMAPEFWLAPRHGLYERREEILQGLEFFQDSVSRQVYHDHLALRLTFDQSLLTTPAIETQYAPADLAPVRQPMRLIDGGAFTGDTVDFFVDQGVRMEALASFEPDMLNFRKLVNSSPRYTEKGIETLLYPCGLGAETGLLRFQGGNGAGSQLTETGDLHVQVLALDDVLPNFRPTLIKLDIEGAEPDALKGARAMIHQGMPDLSVCVYHTPAHLWEIPRLISEMFPLYQFSLRSHRFNGFDTVLYATKR
jgi:FkbM family methyltransferase